MEKKPKSSSVLKNPKRLSDQQVASKRKSYIPEYVRLGMSPLEPAEFSPTDFIFASKKKNSVPLGVKAPPMPTGKVFIKAEEREIPQQFPVASGNNREHTWYPTDEDDQDQFQEYANGPINDDEISLPPMKKARQEHHSYLNELPKRHPNYLIQEQVDEQVNDYEEDFSDEKNSENESVHNLTNGNFYIFLDNKVVYVCDSLPKIESMVEFILFNEASPFEVENAEDLVVMERLPVKIGVTVKK